MDGRQFDGLARILGRGAARRQAVRWLGGLGLAAASLIGGAAVAAPPGAGVACCRHDRNACRDRCRSCGQPFDNAGYICNPEDCEQVAVLCPCCLG
jgi:hypothetical protein